MKQENREQKRKRRERSHVSKDLQFDGWYNEIRGDIVDSSHARFQLYRNQLTQAQAHLEYLLSSAYSTLTILASLSDSFNIVDDQTTEFQTECETILADQKKTAKLAGEVVENLQYYNYLDPITKRLNASGAGSLVRRSEFLEILSNLDTCLDYMQSHPKHRESTMYASKYRLLLTRALTLIRNHFTSSLRDIVADVSKRVVDRQLNYTTMSALLYAKFKAGASELKQLGQEIEKRVKSPPGSAPGAEGEYQGLLNELHQSYSTSRGKLLHPIIQKEIAEIAASASTSKDLVEFARSSTGFMRGLCGDEYTLWGEWFSNEHMLYAFLESLCEPLFDHLRPRTIHETKIVKLCELCSLIQIRYMEDSESESEAESETPKLDFGRLINPALQDAQDRLVFLAQGMLRNDIQYFKPKPENLDYPRRASRVALSGSKGQPALSGRKGSNGEVSRNPLIVGEDGVDREFLMESGTQEYYPTLSKAVWLLSRLYRLVHVSCQVIDLVNLLTYGQSTVFDSIAHDVVHQTTISFDTAATQISARVSPTDSNLFLLSHLLALKHHILAFDIEYTDTDVRVDFAASLWDLRDGMFNPSKWYRALGGSLIPRVVTDMKDARTELDDRLRGVIGELVSAWSKRMATPILSPAVASANGEEKRGRSGARKGMPTSEDAETGAKLRGTIEHEVLLVRNKLNEYLHDRRTRDMLLRAVLEDVLVKYAAWLEAKGLEAMPGKGRAKGKGREDDVWEEEAFEEWAVKAFG